MLISDTVGFLQDLPHNLIASFHATLAEVLEANMLIHIVDATVEDTETRIRIVERVLEEINVEKTTTLLVFNKIDRLFSEEKQRLAGKYPNALFVAAKTGSGCTALKKHLKNYFFKKP
jgi:GTP-binding protein HflX